MNLHKRNPLKDLNWFLQLYLNIKPYKIKETVVKTTVTTRFLIVSLKVNLQPSRRLLELPKKQSISVIQKFAGVQGNSKVDVWNSC